MAKPSSLPEWDTTQVNSIPPDATHKNEGWLAPGGVPEKPPFQTFNHWQNEVYRWVKYFERYYPSIASMKTDTTLEIGNVVNTESYYGNGGAGGGTYDIISATTADGGLHHELDNGLSAKLRNKGSVFIEQYGAVSDWDGATGTDNSSFANAAMLAFDCVKGGAGVFMFATKLTGFEGRQGVALEGVKGGDGRYALGYGAGTALVFTGTGSFISLDGTGTGNQRTYNQKLTGLTVLNEGADVTTSIGIDIADTFAQFQGAIDIIDCTIKGFAYGVNLGFVGWVTVQSCFIQNNLLWGVYGRVNVLRVTNSIVNANGDLTAVADIENLSPADPTGGIHLVNSQGIKISGTDLEANQIGCWFENCAVDIDGGTYFEASKRMALRAFGSNVALTGIYAKSAISPTEQDLFVFYNSAATINGCRSISYCQVGPCDIDINGTGVDKIHKISSADVADYLTADYHNASNTLPGVKYARGRKYIPDLSGTFSDIAETNIAGINTTVTLNADIDGNPLGRNSKTLSHTANGGYGRVLIANGIIAGESFSISVLLKEGNTELITFAIKSSAGVVYANGDVYNMSTTVDENNLCWVTLSGVWNQTIADLAYLWINAGTFGLNDTDTVEIYGMTISNQKDVFELPTSRSMISDTPPTSGYFVQGSEMRYKSPTPGGFMGEVCVANGAPGTWKTHSPITA